MRVIGMKKRIGDFTGKKVYSVTSDPEDWKYYLPQSAYNRIPKSTKTILFRAPFMQKAIEAWSTESDKFGKGFYERVAVRIR